MITSLIRKHAGPGPTSDQPPVLLGDTQVVQYTRRSSHAEFRWPKAPKQKGGLPNLRTQAPANASDAGGNLGGFALRTNETRRSVDKWLGIEISASKG